MDQTALDQIRQQVGAAFASAQPSTPAELANLPEPAEDEEPHLERELQGHAWTELDRDFWLQHWPSFRALLPESFRYFLPSLLTLCLDEASGEWNLVSGTLLILTPSFRRLHDYGLDRRFEYQTSLFNPDQQAAVCSFLGWLLALPEWKMRSAQALKFGWSRIDHEALQQCREFYDSLHHYSRPPIADAELHAIIELIQSAFDERAYPGGDQLCGSDYGDEPAEYALEFKDLDWRTLHPKFLSYHYAALSFFTDAGFAYYLPAFLIADVLGEGGNANPVFHLTHGLYEEPPLNLTSLHPAVLENSGLTAEEIEQMQESIRQTSSIDWHAYAVRRFAGITAPERRAIVAYLEYRAAHIWESEAEKINAALDSYWRASLHPG